VQIPNEKLTNKEWLQQQYEIEKKSMTSIAKEVGVTVRVVSKYIKRYGFQERSAGEAKSLTAFQKGPQSYNKPAKQYFEDKNWLYQKYIIEGLSTRDIVSLMGLHNRRTLKKVLNHFNIPIRSLKEARNNRTLQGKDHRHLDPTIVGKEQQVIDAYIAGRSVNVLKKEFNVSPLTIQKIVKSTNIILRNANEANVGRHHSEETKLKMSLTATDQILNGVRSSYCNGERMTCLTPHNGFVVMRSSWEKKYAEYLKNNNIDFYYEFETFCLSNGKSYIADFYLPNTDEYVEIKGYLSQDQSDKYELFRQEYPNLKWKILYKENLIDLGIALQSHIPTVYLVTGVSGVGKSWVCEQLKDRFTYISYDDIPNKEQILPLFLNANKNKDLLFDPTFKVSTFIKKYSNQLNLIPVFIKETIETITKRRSMRTLNPIPVCQSRIIRINRLANSYGQFSGTSEEVLDFLKNQA